MEKLNRILGKLRGKPVTSEDIEKDPEILKDPCFIDASKFAQEVEQPDPRVTGGTFWASVCSGGIFGSTNFVPSSKWTCDHCHTINPEKNVVCEYCGAPHKDEKKC